MPRRELQLDTEQFLARYWQKMPLLLSGALPGFEPPVTADELAGLAMDDNVESRIIEQQQDTWLLHHGPFTESGFQRDNPWTLLVQAVDHYLPDVARLRQLVGFLPSWRVDDVMVSYAVDGGSVGPHYDNYDVFLLQGEGQRLWRLGQRCDADSDLLPHDSLKILREFECQQEFLLGPGDILYVPPGLAHWGIARGECTTFSIGFRAPRLNAMVSRWVDRLLEQLDPELFYRDLHCEPAVRPGEIRPRDLERAMAQLQAALDQAEDNRWFGELVTEPRYDPDPGPGEADAVRARLAAPGATVELLPEAKLAWQEDPAGILVYANGESELFASAVQSDLEALCGDWRLAVQDREGLDELLDFLIERGVIDVC